MITQEQAPWVAELGRLLAPEAEVFAEELLAELRGDPAARPLAAQWAVEGVATALREAAQLVAANADEQLLDRVGELAELLATSTGARGCHALAAALRRRVTPRLLTAAAGDASCLAGLLGGLEALLEAACRGVLERLSVRWAGVERDALFLDSIVENLPHMVFVKRFPDLRFVRFNRAGEELLGYPREAMIGKNDYDFFPREEADFFTRKDLQVLEGREPVSIPEEPIQTRTHGLRYLHTKKIPLCDAAGEPRYLLGISEDITERRATQAELERARDAAEAGARAKGQFLAQMSHEIRTPMNGIIGMIELALDAELAPAQRRQLSLARESATSLLTVLNDILDFSKIDAGRLELVPEPFDLHERVTRAVEAFAVVAEGKGLAWELSIDPRLPRTVVGDVHRVKQVIVNLMHNAIRHTDAGGIALRVEPLAQEAETLLIRFSVADTGVGLPADDREALFEPFTQATGAAARRQGTGLGLAIARRLVELLGGRIWVEDNPGGGSVFQFSARFGLGSEAPAPAPAAPAPVPALRVLVAEDNRVNAVLMVALLEARGHRVVVVDSGRRVLEALEQEAFDVILMDVEMPELDGLETTRALRQAGRRLPVVALTAHALPEDRQRCFAAGMDAYLAKPVDRTELFATLAEVWNGSAAGEGEA